MKPKCSGTISTTAQTVSGSKSLISPKQRGFLAAYRQLANITSAAKKCKLARRTHYDWLEDDQYREAFADAQLEAGEALEKEARRRAVTGTLKPVFYKGEVVGKIREYSDILLIFLLKGCFPKKYRDNSKIEEEPEAARNPINIEVVFVDPNKEPPCPSKAPAANSTSLPMPSSLR